MNAALEDWRIGRRGVRGGEGWRGWAGSGGWWNVCFLYRRVEGEEDFQPNN